MPSREEIREGVRRTIHLKSMGTTDEQDNHLTDHIIKYLHSQGVVIKVEDQTIQVEMPADGKRTGLKVPYHLENLGKNIVAVEPLIKEVSDAKRKRG